MILDTIQYITGGLMISSALALKQKFGKTNTESSNSVFNMLTLDSKSQWNSSFIAGMLFFACLCYSIFHLKESSWIVNPFEPDKLFFQGTGLIQFMISALLIGFGTKLAQGGLNTFSFSGIPKFDRNSLVATLTVLIFAGFSATTRGIIPLLKGLNVSKFFNEHLDFRLSFIFPLALLVFSLTKNLNNPNNVKEILTSFGIGNFLAAGMMCAGLTRRHLVLDFLNISSKHWSPFLVFVALGAFLGNMLMTNTFKIQGASEEASSSGLSAKVLIGCASFGMGMGMTGLTPGSGLIVSAIYLPQVLLFFLPFLIIGQTGGRMVGRIFGGSEKAVKTE